MVSLCTVFHSADWLNELSNPLGIHGLSVVNMCGKLNKGIFLVYIISAGKSESTNGVGAC